MGIIIILCQVLFHVRATKTGSAPSTTNKACKASKKDQRGKKRKTNDISLANSAIHKNSPIYLSITHPPKLPVGSKSNAANGLLPSKAASMDQNKQRKKEIGDTESIAVLSWKRTAGMRSL